MTYVSDTCKCNIWRKTGRKILKILIFLFLNLVSARQPCPVQSLNSQTVRYLECCRMFRVWYAKELNICLLKRKSSIPPMQTGLLFVIKELIHLMQSETQNLDYRDYLAVTRSFRIHSVLARLGFSSICLGSLHCASL